MNLVFRYALVPFINWGTYVFYFIILLIAASKRSGWFVSASHCLAKCFNYLSKISYKSLIWLTLVFKIFYAASETFSQYYVWSSNGFTKLLLSNSAVDFTLLKKISGNLFLFLNNRFGYFIFYSWGRFWKEIVVSLMAAAIFYLFLVFLKKYQERFFEEGETELGFLLALMVGWSNFIVFLPIVFVSVILVSVFRQLVFKESYTTLGIPFILSALIVLLFGNYLVSLLGLTSLRV